MDENILRIAAIKGIIDMVEAEAAKPVIPEKLHEDAIEFIYGVCLLAKTELDMSGE